MTHLMQNNAFYASMLLRQKIEMTKDCETFDVDGKTLRFNPDFSESMTLLENVGVLAHEMEHLTGLHHIRGRGKDSKTWNRAADLAINPILLRAGFKLPAGVLNEARFHGKCAEDIYRTLMTEESKKQGKKPQSNSQSQNGNGKPGNGQGKSEKGEGEGEGEKTFGNVSPSPDESEKAEEKAKVDIVSSISTAKSRGQLPAHVARIFESIPSRADWREILARFLSERAFNDYTLAKPNRRYLSSGFYLPTLYSKTFGKVIFVADTSGSIQPKEINAFIAELQEMLKVYAEDGQIPEITAIWCDSVIQGVQELNDSTLPEPKGGGGTDFDPPFKYIEEHQLNPVAVIYFTDGYGPVTVNPDYPVIWALTMHNNSFNPHFGEKVYIGSDLL